MKIGKKHIILFILAVSLLIIGYKYTEIKNLINGPPDGDVSAGTVTPRNDTQSSMYFSKNRLERDTLRSKTKEIYELITKDKNTAPELKNEVYEKIISLSELSMLEIKIEGLIREKGYNDAFAVFNDSGEIDVLVKSPSLESAQVAQIADIIIRQSGLEYKNIHIRRVA